MSDPKAVFYPVGNGDMTLIKLADLRETTILIDIHVRQCSTDDKDEDAYNVIEDLKKNLRKDPQGRYRLDAFILTHGDKDHISGLKEHFHLDELDKYSDKDKESGKIIINEMWSSCRFWERSSDDDKLTEDTKAFNKEMKRRVKLFEKFNSIQEEGNRAQIIGSDHDNTKDIMGIVNELKDKINIINNTRISDFEMIPLGPLEKQEGKEDDEQFNARNRWSVILQFRITRAGTLHKVLITGDAEYKVWEFNNEIYDDEYLEYDILQLPHHCSMSCLGSKDDGGKYVVSDEAKNALSYARDKSTAIMISSSKEIIDDDNNPPHFDAKQEYLTIIDDEENFLCTEEYEQGGNKVPIEISFTKNGTQLLKAVSGVATSTAGANTATKAHEHG